MCKKIMSLLLAVLLIAALVPASALAADAAGSGDFTIDQNGTLTKYNGPGGNVVIPDGVKSVGGFSDCDALLSVTFPDSVTSIQYSAFKGCSSLKEISLPASVTSIGSAAFKDCKSLESIIIPNGITGIESSTFENCLKLTQVILPNSVTYISYQAFCHCASLARINIPDGVTKIGDSAFLGCSALTQVTLPDGLTGIGCKAFAGCGMSQITIPGSVRTNVKGYDSTNAFEGCGNLTTAIICEGVDSIPSNEFWNCVNLKTVYIPTSVTSIGEITTNASSGATRQTSAFTNASALTDVYYAGTQAQWNQITIALTQYNDPAKVDPLEVATIHYNSPAPASPSTPSTPTTPSTPDTPSATTTQTKDANGNTFEFTLDTASNGWTLTRFTAGSNPKSVTVPGTVEGKPVTAIGTMAFAAQAAVETLQLPDTVTSIGDRAFMNCWGLKTVNIPQSTTIIGYSAFEECKALETIQFPDALTTIETRAFYNCTSLTSVCIPNSVVNFGTKTLEPDNWGYSGRVFEGCTSLKNISLGVGMTDFYKAFVGTAVETAVVPATVNKSLYVQCGAGFDRYTYQTYQMYTNCKNLKTAYVESGVRVLTFTFSGCTGLEALYLPKSITTMDYALSVGSSHHIDIYYEGTQEEFDKISFSSDYSKYITVHYNSYTPDNVSTDRTRAALAAADALYDLGLFNGVGTDPSGKPLYSLGRAPTRYEAVTMLVRLLGKEEEALAGVWNTPFTDVTEWAKPYVGYAYAHGLTNGVSADRFGGTSTATKAQYATFILRALGYTSGTDFQWNAPWELLAKTGVMLEGSDYWRVLISLVDSGFTRSDVVLMSFLSLTAKIKGTDTTLLEKILDGSGTHTHSYQTYIIPAVGSYQQVAVEQTATAVEAHCGACGYISYDADDMERHGCFSNTIMATHKQPWYSYTWSWVEGNWPTVTLDVCTVCGAVE